MLLAQEANNQDPTLQRLIFIKGGVYGLIENLFRGILSLKICHPSPKFSKKKNVIPINAKRHLTVRHHITSTSMAKIKD